MFDTRLADRESVKPETPERLEASFVCAGCKIETWFGQLVIFQEANHFDLINISIDNICTATGYLIDHESQFFDPREGQ